MNLTSKQLIKNEICKTDLKLSLQSKSLDEGVRHMIKLLEA